MKRMLLKILLLSCVILFATPWLNGTLASQGSMEIVCDDDTGTVTVSGAIPSGHIDRKIMLFVINPDKTMEGMETATEEVIAYAAQTVTDADGQFEFVFNIGHNAIGGNYTVRVGAALGDEVLTDSFYYATENLINEVLQKINSASSGAELGGYINTYIECVKVDLTGDFANLANPERVFSAMNQKHDYASMNEVRAAFDAAVAEQKAAEDNETMVSQINSADATAMEQTLLAFQDVLNLPIAESEDPFSKDYNAKNSAGEYINKAFVHKAMSAYSFSVQGGSEEIQREFYKALAVSVINNLNRGQNFELGNVLSRYSAYIALPNSYLEYPDKVEIHKLIIGTQYQSVDSLIEAIEDAVLVLKADEKKPSQSGGSSTTTTIRGGGGSNGAVTVPPSVPIPSADDAADETEKLLFDDLTDVPWAKEGIEELVNTGVLKGVGENKFGPHLLVTREQFVAMLVRAFQLEEPHAKSTFADVDESSWYYTSVAAAQGLGIVQGNDNGCFGVGEPITRQDMAVLVYRLINDENIKFDSQETNGFTDMDAVSGYAVEAVGAMHNAGIIRGFGDGRFAPLQNATRAEAAQMIHRLLKLT